MPIGQLSAFLRQLRESATRDSAAQLPDRQLLDAFVRERDEGAFTALLARHGPMVLSVCRRVLHDSPEAEDAFQATFLVLVRKAATLQKRELLSHWLYGTAYRTATRARVEAARRQARESRAPVREPADPLAEITVRELCAVLDREVYRLPVLYRAPLILCYLQGRTRDEAAQQLGWSLATLGRRLERGRLLLRHRLVRHGLTLSVALLPALLTQSATSATVPPALGASTVQAALGTAAGTTMAAGLVTPRVISLTEGVMRAMRLKKLTSTVALILILVLVPGAALWWPSIFLQGQAAAEQGETRLPGQGPEKGQPASDQEKLQGTWVVVGGEAAGQKFNPEVGKNRPLTIVFRGDRARFVEAEKQNPPPFHQGFGTFRLDTTRQPKTLDVQYGPAGPGEDPWKTRFPGIDMTRSQAPPGLLTGTVPCIYRLEGNTLTICFRGFDSWGAVRPTSFTTQRGGKLPTILLILKRVEEAEKGKDERQPAEGEPQAPAKPSEGKPQPKGAQPGQEGPKGQPKGKERPDESAPIQKPAGEGKPQPKREGDPETPTPGEQRMEENYCKVEIRGSLVVTNKPEMVPGRTGLDSQSLAVTVYTGQVVLPLYFGGDKDLLAAAAKLNGKTVLLTGKLLRQNPGPGSGLNPPQFVDYVRVATLQPAGPPPAFPAKKDSTAKLLKDLERDNAFARAAAIDLLGQRKAWEAIPRLIDLLNDGTALVGSDNWVGGHAAGALAAITGRPFSTDQVEWRKWWKGQKKGASQ